MNPPNNSGDRDPTEHPLPPNEVSSSGIELHLTELLAKGIP